MGAKLLLALMILTPSTLVLLHGTDLYGQVIVSSFETPEVAVAPQYSTTHVYVEPKDLDAFAKCFLGTLGGTSTKQVVVTVTPTSSSTTSQLLQTPSGTISLFGFTTPIPAPFGTERHGYLVRNMASALSAARSLGAGVIVTPFPDPIGIDAVIQWPGGVNMQLYWHNTAANYAALKWIPENRVYISADTVSDFLRGFVAFAHGRVVSDQSAAQGIEVGRPGDTFRRIMVDSNFGHMTIFVTDGHLPYPYGLENTGYEVSDLAETLKKAVSLGARVLVQAVAVDDREEAMVLFPGGYIAAVYSNRTNLSK
jgi:hypothetical protein